MNQAGAKKTGQFTQWLASWRRDLSDLVVPADGELNDVDYLDLIMTHYLSSLDTLMVDATVMKALSSIYTKLHANTGEANAKYAIRRFISDSCWICAPSVNAVQHRRQESAPKLSDLKTDLIALQKAALKIAVQIKRLPLHFAGGVSVEYLQGRMAAGNPVTFILSRKTAWNHPVPHESTPDSIGDLMRCFACDMEEEAALIQIAIDASRQKGGKLNSLHFAMVGLSDASLRLSTASPAMPQFALVTNVIDSLMHPLSGIDPTTVRKHYRAVQMRKTRS